MLKKPLAIAIAASAMTAGIASAEVTGSLDVSSDYLFRGISKGAPQVSGSLDWSHDSGMYAGIWASNTVAGIVENDYYFGYAGGDSFTYDVGLIQYRYPENTTIGELASGGEFDGNNWLYYNEFYILLGSEMGLGFEAWLGFEDYHTAAANRATTEDESMSNDRSYYALTYNKNAFGAVVGFYDNGEDYAAGITDAETYTHIDLSYSITDNLTMTASQIVASDVEAATSVADDTGLSVDDVLNNDLKFVISYGFDI